MSYRLVVTSISLVLSYLTALSVTQITGIWRRIVNNELKMVRKGVVEA
jgi:hypothetical protein